MFEVEVISGSIFRNKTSLEKVDLLLHYIKKNQGKVLVIEDPLSPQEEAMLIEQTMLGIDEKFKGIEVAVIREENLSFAEKIAAILGIRKGITVIGPSTVIQQIKREKEPQRILLGAISRTNINNVSSVKNRKKVINKNPNSGEIKEI